MPTPTTFAQTPPSLSFSQSPVVFSVKNDAYLSSSFYYSCDLSIWYGQQSDSGSANATTYALRKYPNNTGYGIFEIGRFLSSGYITTLSGDTNFANPSNIINYKANFNYSFLSGSVFYSGSILSSSVYHAADGYKVSPETIQSSAQSTTPYWPIMTSGPATQSVNINDTGFLSVYASGSISLTTIYTGSYSNGTTVQTTYVQNFSALTTGSSLYFVRRTPSAPSQANFPLPKTNSGGDLVSYNIKVTGPVLSPVTSQAITYNVDCVYQYTPVRILWKNRYGQFDFFNFYMKNIQTMETEQRVYQPQLGSWQSSELVVDSLRNSKQRYIVDTNETLTVNTDFISEDYNEIFKQLLVTDEAYWNYDVNSYKPLGIRSNSILFKTGVNDKLIQYTLTFDLGQPFKLII